MSTAASLTALLQGTLDYAGMFPPASLDLSEAVAEFRAIRASPEQWMLARFVVPVDMLDSFARQHTADLQNAAPPWQIAVIASPVPAFDALGTATSADGPRLALFSGRFGASVQVATYEVRLPAPAGLSDLGAQREAVTHVRQSFNPGGSTRIFYEVSFGHDWESVVRSAAEAIAESNRASGLRDGLKIRCGGPTAADIPSAEKVAFAIVAARDADIPIKFTSGLHHPVRHHDTELNVKAHGFLNILTASVLAYTLDLNWVNTQRIVQSSDASQFRFGDDQLAWGEYVADINAISSARQQFAASFGSCTFDEPRADLQASGLLKS
jgi:hypothetical protein